MREKTFSGEPTKEPPTLTRAEIGAGTTQYTSGSNLDAHEAGWQSVTLYKGGDATMEMLATIVSGIMSFVMAEWGTWT